MKYYAIALLVLAGSVAALTDDAAFSSHLAAKFQVKACTNCHDFFDEKRGGRALTTHKGRTVQTCVACHNKDVTGFTQVDEWFARPGLYMSGMSPQETCEAMMSALNAKFMNKTRLARELEEHFFNDPRVLWAIEGATPGSGRLPQKLAQKDLVKGGLDEWKHQVKAWIDGGMLCK
ncbi:MAG: hypothetical protein AABZ44_07230 [Elusimicrobiota bacterium]